jgi:hypothetical protein
MSYLETLPKVQDLINSLLIVLSDKEKFIIENRFSLNEHPRMTLEKIGEKYNVTRERIRQIEKNALRKLERNVNNTQLRDVTSLALQILEQNGGLLSEDALTSAILKLANEDIESTIDVNSLKLTVDLDKSITHEHNTIRFRPYWRLANVKPAQVKKVCELMSKELKKAGKVLNFTKLASFCREKISIDGLNENFVRAAATLDRELKVVDEGVGLAAWREINPKTLRDKIFYIFNRYKKPLHYVDIANMIGDTSFDRKSVNTQAVHNELIRYPEFILIGRGIYALKEWGFEEGTVAEVIEKVLIDNGELTRDEIVAKVLERRQVKKITILLNLKNKEQFLKVGKDRFRLEK